MAVIMIADVAGQDAPGYDRMLSLLEARIRQADGFIAHAGHAIDGGWRCIELWRSKAECDRFYAEQVAPHLPPGIRPKRKVHELHRLVATLPAALEVAA